MLPLGPPGFADSPYAALSAFAGNPLLISLGSIADCGLLTRRDIAETIQGDPERADFGAVLASKMAKLRMACRVFFSVGDSELTDFDGFCSINGMWLEDYALFMALKGEHGGKSWMEWPDGLRMRDHQTLNEARLRLSDEMRFWKFTQFLFGQQWEDLRKYCRDRGISLMGDMPIFVNLDSSDVWANQGFFLLDADGNPEVVAGVPPDYFSAEGQRWGNPVYRWNALRGRGYGWWVDRFRRTFALFDAVRIDHFIGFHRHWEIPAAARTAREGRYAPGPGADFFETVRGQLGTLPLLAEDLGIVTPEVVALRERFGFPGMSVLQFAFGPPHDGKNPYLPANCRPDSWIYTGTHDNDTTMGWYAGTEGGRASTRSPEQVELERAGFRKALGREVTEPNWDLIQMAMETECSVSVFPAQDLLGLGSSARMNVPGVDEGNWAWRMKPGALTPDIALRLAGLSRASRRSAR